MRSVSETVLHGGVLLPFEIWEAAALPWRAQRPVRESAKELSTAAAAWSTRSRSIFLVAHRVNAHSPCMPGLATVTWPAPAHPPVAGAGALALDRGESAGYSWSLTWASVPKDALSAGSDGRFGVVTPAAGS